MVSNLFQITKASYSTHHKFYHDWTNRLFAVAQLEKLANIILVAGSICSMDNIRILSKFLYCYKVKNTLACKVSGTSLDYHSVVFRSI